MRRRILFDKEKIITNYEYVDLGLPSGLKWAKCNIGANSETEYGDYYLWGALTPHDYENYNYYNGEELILPSEYDIAYQIMGGGWRIPTKEDFEELINSTNKSYLYDNGIKVLKFSKIGDEETYVYFPAAGSITGNMGDSPGNVNLSFDYWTSTSYGEYHAYDYTDYGPLNDYAEVSGSYRNYANPIKPVFDN